MLLLITMRSDPTSCCTGMPNKFVHFRGDYTASVHWKKNAVMTSTWNGLKAFFPTITLRLRKDSQIIFRTYNPIKLYLIWGPERSSWESAHWCRKHFHRRYWRLRWPPPHRPASRWRTPPCSPTCPPSPSPWSPQTPAGSQAAMTRLVPLQKTCGHVCEWIRLEIFF